MLAKMHWSRLSGDRNMEILLGACSWYLWIGRGSTFNVFDTVDNLSQSDIMLYTPWFAFQTHAYHSGPLTLLIDYGLPGFLIGTWLLLAIGVSAWKIAAKWFGIALLSQGIV